eukprot:RCo021217
MAFPLKMEDHVALLERHAVKCRLAVCLLNFLKVYGTEAVLAVDGNGLQTDSLKVAFPSMEDHFFVSDTQVLVAFKNRQARLSGTDHVEDTAEGKSLVGVKACVGSPVPRQPGVVGIKELMRGLRTCSQNLRYQASDAAAALFTPEPIAEPDLEPTQPAVAVTPAPHLPHPQLQPPQPTALGVMGGQGR